jgi:SAM-dependent methyltransferase
MAVREVYINGEYLRNNPDWHLNAAPWKAQAVLQMIKRNQLTPKSVCDVGCGVGEISHILQQHLANDCHFSGYEISPQAIALAKARENERLQFFLADFKQEKDAYYDLILLIDVLQHIEDSYEYLRKIKSRSEYKIIQVPLNISALSAIQNTVMGDNGHINFYTKDIVLRLLRDCGYEVIDHFYTLSEHDATSWSLNPRKLLGKTKRLVTHGLKRLPAHICYSFDEDLAVRIFGGWRLITLVR